MPRFKDQAVCIRHIDWSETSQVVALFTREHGKVRGIAKGSKRTSPSSVQRFSGGIELLTRGEVVATTKTTTDLAAITEWDLQDPYRHLRTDLDAQRLAMYAADIVGALTEDQDAHPNAFDALVVFLEGIATPQAADGQRELLRFQWDLLADCGFRPQLDADATTGQALGADEDGLWFDAHAGGLTRAAHHGGFGGRVADAGPWRVRKETVELLRALSSNSPDAFALDDSASVQRANRLLCVYIRAVLDRRLPTMGFILNA